MDDTRFDRLTLVFAGSTTRRQVVAALLAAGATAVSSFGASARQRCLPIARSCRKDGECCSGSCEKDDRSGRNVCATEPQPACDNFVCGDLCCPAEAVGCAAIDAPGGPNISCQCPRGQEYVDGQCKAIECPSGTNCAGFVACGDVTNESLCCSYPLSAYCVCQSPITGEPEVGCCTPGLDCPKDLDWQGYAWNHYVGPCVEDGVVVCCCETQSCEWAGTAAQFCDGS